MRYQVRIPYQFQLPNEKQIENVAKVTGVVLAVVVVAKLVTTISEKVHEKKQDREIKKLKAQVESQESRLAKLEKA